MAALPIDLDAFDAAPLTREPFPFLMLPRFVKPEAMAAINADYPEVHHPGSFPLPTLQYGPAFAAFAAAIQGPEFTRAVEQKLGVNLEGRPTMVTARGQSAARDGQIHTDSRTKLITVLIYFNDPWEAKGGRLRLLRSPTDLNDMIGEVPPDAGTMIAFRRSDRSYHGHEPFEGVRRYVMINWMTSGFAAQRELFRHRLSARVKQAASLLKPAAQQAEGAHG